MTCRVFWDGWPLAVVLALAACGSQGTVAEEESSGPAATAVTVWSDAVELFFEYLPLVAGAPGEPWAVHVTDLSTFKPVTEGILTLHLTGPDGNAQRFAAEVPVRPGIFAPAPSLATAGRFDLVVEIESPTVRDRVPAGVVTVHASIDDVPQGGDEDDTGAITFLKEQQWPIPFATQPAVIREVLRAIRVPGEIVPAGDRLAGLDAPADGLVSPELNRSDPIVGDRVRRGQRLAVLAPVDNEGSFAALVARVERLERELARVERLLELEAVPARRVEETRHDLDLAQSALAAMGGRAAEGYGLVIRAPFDGIIAERRLVLGQRVAAGDRLFTLVDPDSVWLRVQVPAREAVELHVAVGATFTVEGGDRLYRAERAVAVGHLIDPERRTVPVVFDVANRDRSLRIGALAQVRVLSREAVSGVALPASAVRDEDGIPVTYVHTAGESFERRILALGPSDGEWVIVRSGVAGGERAVTIGAYQVRLASLNTGVIADHGHPH